MNTSEFWLRVITTKFKSDYKTEVNIVVFPNIVVNLGEIRGETIFLNDEIIKKKLDEIELHFPGQLPENQRKKFVYAVLSGNRDRELEEKLTCYPDLLYRYIKYVIKDRFRELEVFVISQEYIESATRYILEFVKSRDNKKFEQKLKDIPALAYIYAYKIQERFTEAEPNILLDPKIAILYATYVMREKWPEAEKNMYLINPKDGYVVYDYITTIVKERCKEAEYVLFRNVNLKEEYVRFLNKEPFCFTIEKNEEAIFFLSTMNISKIKIKSSVKLLKNKNKMLSLLYSKNLSFFDTFYSEFVQKLQGFYDDYVLSVEISKTSNILHFNCEVYDINERRKNVSIELISL